MAHNSQHIAGNVYDNIQVGDNARALVGNEINNHNYTVLVHRRRSRYIGHAEAITLPRAIPGLGNLSARLYEQLTDLVIELTNPPDYLQTLALELGSYTEKIATIQSRLSDKRSSPGRTSLIPVSHVVVSFTDAVTVLNQLHKVLDVLAVEDEMTGVQIGADQARELRSLKSRLQWQNMLSQMQIDILESDTDAEGRRLSLEADEHIIAKLRQDPELRKRLSDAESELSEASLQIETLQVISNTERLDRDASVEVSSGQALQSDRDGNRRSLLFEEALNSQLDERDQSERDSFSFRCVGARWSTLSEISIDNTSILSAVSLPIRISELVTASSYADPDLVKEADSGLEVDFEFGGPDKNRSPKTAAESESSADDASYFSSDQKIKTTDEDQRKLLSIGKNMETKAAAHLDSRASTKKIHTAAVSNKYAASCTDQKGYSSRGFDDTPSSNVRIHSDNLMSYPTSTRLRKDLSYSGLTTLPSDILRFSNVLSSLDLSNNKLDQFPDMLPELVSLQDLNLSHNSIRKLPEDMQNLKSLKTLLVSSNPIVYLPLALFRMPKLERLLIDRDSLEIIPPRFRRDEPLDLTVRNPYTDFKALKTYLPYLREKLDSDDQLCGLVLKARGLSRFMAIEVRRLRDHFERTMWPNSGEQNEDKIDGKTRWVAVLLCSYILGNNMTFNVVLTNIDQWPTPGNFEVQFWEMCDGICTLWMGLRDQVYGKVALDKARIMAILDSDIVDLRNSLNESQRYMDYMAKKFDLQPSSP